MRFLIRIIKSLLAATTLCGASTSYSKRHGLLCSQYNTSEGRDSQGMFLASLTVLRRAVCSAEAGQHKHNKESKIIPTCLRICDESTRSSSPVLGTTRCKKAFIWRLPRICIWHPWMMSASVTFGSLALRLIARRRALTRAFLM